MKTAQILLHALPHELLSLVERRLAKGGLYAAVIWITPAFSVTQVRTASELKDEVSGKSMPFRICLARGPFDLRAATLYEFMEGNAIGCIVDIGALDREGLKESSVWISAEDIAEWKSWSNFAKEIKESTSAGLWAVSPVSGAKKFCKNNRYTAGAANLAHEGQKLLPLAGWNFFEINDDAP
jgi:hypothetical protein